MKEWYYAEDGQQQGPVPQDRIVEMLRSGTLAADALVWTEGMSAWAPASKTETLAEPDVSPPDIPTPEPETPDAPELTTKGPLFLHVSMTRLIFMSVVSMGLYQAYWIYKNWRFLKDRDGLQIQPFWRGFFGLFFIYSIFKTIREDEQLNRIEKATFPAGALAVAWIVLTFLANALSRVEDDGISALGMLVAFPLFLFFVPVQDYINRVNAKLTPRPEHTPWTIGHMVCLFIGILFWGFACLGIMAPPQ
jgi:hypothetical protein